jgi:hypothetical protein
MKPNKQDNREIKGIDYTKDNVFDAIGRPDLKPVEVKGEYVSGISMEQFKHIPEISNYNFNYYVGFNKDLLFGKSDDDNHTDWWLIRGTENIYIGYSLTSDNEKLIIMLEPQS